MLRAASLGFALGLGGCIVLGEGGATPEDAACVVDYDECIGLGVDESICESIYEACAGAGGDGGTGGPDEGGDGCWDEVQQCLEENDGDEEACTDLIQECEDPPDPGGEDDGASCWEEVEACFDTNPDDAECEALAEMCLGADGGEDQGAVDEGGDECEAILEMCVDDTGEIPDECWAQYEECIGSEPPPPCDDEADPDCCFDQGCCDQDYENCIAETGDEELCAAQYDECVGGNPDPTAGMGGLDYCEGIYEHCTATQDDMTCETVDSLCQEGEPLEQCFQQFFECAGVEQGDTQALWEVDETMVAACYEELVNCG